MVRKDCIAVVMIAATGWLGACQTQAPATPAAAPPATPATAAPPIDWASAPDCPAKLALLERAVRDGRELAGAPLPIVVVLPGGPGISDWLAPPSVTLAADLPLAVHDRSELERLDAPCVLMVDEPRDQKVEHRLIARDTVRSFYQNGVRSERNPDYERAQLRVREAERSLKDDGLGIMAVGDPMLDLVGTLLNSLVSGFHQGKGERELDAAMVELASTPRSHDRPLYRAYEFEQMTVRAGKQATIPVALLDRTSGRVWRTELRQRERREFAVIDGLDPRDRDYEARRAASLTRHEFERWQREPPRLQLSALATALSTSAQPAPRPAHGTRIVAIPDRRAALAARDPHDLDAALPLAAGAADRRQALPPTRTTAPLAPPAAMQAAAPGDARAAATVAILTDDGTGGGVYVRDDLVLTTAALVGHASVVDVVADSGARVLGLVARSDRLRNLALVQVARPGAPATLHDGLPPPPGSQVAALLPDATGRPKAAAGRYLGSGGAAEGALASLAGLVAIDAPALPTQPEGTPWFAGEALIALGTASMGDGEGGPLSAVDAAQIADFLYGSGGALAALR